MTDNNLKYKIAFSFLNGVGSITGKKLIAYLGSVEAVFTEKESRLKKVPGVGEHFAKIVANSDAVSRAEKELEFIEKYNIRPLFYLDKDYPERLKQCNDAPLMIYVKGNAEMNPKKVLSFVGTRNATPYGKEICEKIIKDLAERGHNPLIVSGLAYGIDICAHKAALNNGLQTVAVLGHGLEKIYPAAHKKYAKEIVGQGALMTDFGSFSNTHRQNFVSRNRIVAGLSDATIVIESAKKGGSLITAEIAVSYNRDLLTVPGRIGDSRSEGCNFLIKTHKAALIESVDDIEYQLGWKNKEPVQQKLFADITDDEKPIIELIKEHQQIQIDTLAMLLGKPVSMVSAHLLQLEFKGFVRSLPGKVFKLAN